MSLDKIDPTQLESWELMLLRATHEMSLSETQYGVIEDRYTLLQKALDAADDPLLDHAHVFVQGSIGLRTTIKPALGATGAMATIDADAVVWLPQAVGAESQKVLDAIEKRFSEATRVEEPVEQLRRGIRIKYADENPGFHIDITPAITAAGNSKVNGHGALQVPDRYQGWKASSPRLYSEWLDTVASQRVEMLGVRYLAEQGILMKDATQDPLPDYADYVDGNPLRAAIKLLKRHRDVWAIENREEEHRPISAVITTLAGRSYEKLVQRGETAHLRPIEVVMAIVDQMPSFVRLGLGGYEVCNPHDSGENFAEKWNRPGLEGRQYKSAFDRWHGAAMQSVRMGLLDQGSDTAFREAFAGRFGIRESMVRDVVRDLPSTWTLPGRKAGTSRNTEIVSNLFGSHVASSESQRNVEGTGRLG